MISRPRRALRRLQKKKKVFYTRLYYFDILFILEITNLWFCYVYTYEKKKFIRINI